jgi:hypothetical protein
LIGDGGGLTRGRMLPVLFIFFACLLALAWLFHNQRERHRRKREDEASLRASHRRWLETLEGKTARTPPRDGGSDSYGEYQERRGDR